MTRYARRRAGDPHPGSPPLAVGLKPAGWRALLAHSLQYTPIAVVVALAVLLRVLWPQVAEFKGDEVQPVALADQIWHEHRLPATRGFTSTGLPGTALVAYLLVLPRAVSSDPRLAVAFIGLLDGLAVPVTYLGLRRPAGERVALAAAALYAANPWAIVFSRKTWSEILPLFTVVILWSAYRVVAERKPAAALIFFPFLALQVQVHVMGVLLLPAALLTVLCFWPRWRNRYTLWAIALGILILMPYALALAARWPETRAILRQNAESGPIVDLRAITYGLWFASGATISALMGRSVAVLRSWEQALRVINIVTTGLLLCGLAGSIRAVIRRESGWERHALLLTWLAGPVLPMVFIRGAKGIHYLLILVPVLFILVGAVWARLLSLRRRSLALAATLAFIAVLAVQAGAVLAVYHGVVRWPTDGGFGWPLGVWQQVQRGVQAHLAAEGRRELQVLGIDDAPWSGQRAVLDYLLRRTVPLRYVGQGGRPGVLLPTTGNSLALVMAADAEMQRVLARFGEELGCWQIPGNEWGVRLFRLRGYIEAEAEKDMTFPASATFDNGMRLIGARMLSPAEPGGKLALTTCWTYTGQATATARTDMAFNHVLDASGRRWAQTDSFALSYGEWRPGDILLQWFDIPLPGDLPAGDYWLYIGMYSWRDMTRANVIDAGGRQIGDGVKLGPIRVVR